MKSAMRRGSGPVQAMVPVCCSAGPSKATTAAARSCTDALIAMTLIAILIATLAAGIGSVWAAALLMRMGLGGRHDGVGPQHLLSLAAGALLATAFMHLLPEAFESQAGAHDLFATLLVGVVFFFLLDKAELWHHGHEHSHAEPAAHDAHHDHHGHHHGHDHGHAHHHGPRAGGWALLTGDSVHCFGDGILIASAFMADMRLGVIAAVSVLAHEVPHHMGDLVVLRQSSANRRMALLKVSLAGAVTALGGAVAMSALLPWPAGCWLQGLHQRLPQRCVAVGRLDEQLGLPGLERQ
jgi:zinc and cadmium transporter